MIIQSDTERIERGDGLSLPATISFPNGKTYTLTGVGFEGPALSGRYECMSYMGHRSARSVYYLRADGRFSSYKPSGVRFNRRPNPEGA